MKITFLAKTKLGKWSIGLIIAFLAFIGIFLLFIALGERGGQTFFSNLKLALSGLSSAASAIASFIVGLISIIKSKERSVLVFISSLIGFLILLWVLAEILFPH